MNSSAYLDDCATNAFKNLVRPLICGPAAISEIPSLNTAQDPDTERWIEMREVNAQHPHAHLVGNQPNACTPAHLDLPVPHRQSA